MEWWQTMKVDGNSLLFTNALPGGESEVALVVAELASEAEAQAMFRAVRRFMACGARRFRALDVAPEEIS